MSARDASWKRQWVNPIMVKCARSRLRWQHMLSWGVVLFTITAFFASVVYFPMVERNFTEPKIAARAILMPVIIIQAVILMLSGTGAVASGMARERLKELVDYHRMTPMSPGRKLVGFLFGLPAREYFLFALTLPFVAFAVIVGEFPLGTLAHFYVVFFSSVMVYHLVGLVAGMVVPKPYFALVLSQGLVLMLYLILPQLSRFGITFFEFLTIRPTLMGLIAQEIESVSPGAALVASDRIASLDGFRNVPVFDTLVHPTAYTFIVQSFLIVLLVTVLLRKWKSEQAHLYSKLQGFFAFGGLGAFVIASVWAMLSRDDMIPEELLEVMSENVAYPATYVFEILLVIMIALMGTASVVFSGAFTSSKLTFERGIRRILKLGRSRLHPDSDASSGLPATFGMIGAFVVCIALMVWVAARKGEAFEAPPSVAAWIPLVFTVGGAVLFAQGVRERFGMRAVLVGMFVVWCIPFFVGIIVIGAFERHTLGTYVCLPCPVMAVLVGMQDVVSNATFESGIVPESVVFMDEIESDISKMMIVSAVFHGGLALAVHLENWRYRRQIAARERGAWATREAT